MTTNNKPRRMARPPDAAPKTTNSLTETASVDASPASPKRTTKQALVLEMVQREGGVPLSALVAATGWLPHTVRAALTGLRKKGHNIVRIKTDGETCYAVTAAPTL